MKTQDIEIIRDAESGLLTDVQVHTDVFDAEKQLHMVEEKSVLKSKTMWFNLLATLLTVIATFLPELQPYMSNGVYLGVLMVVTFGNKAIRLVTRAPVSPPPNLPLLGEGAKRTAGKHTGGKHHG